MQTVFFALVVNITQNTRLARRTKNFRLLKNIHCRKSLSVPILAAIETIKQTRNATKYLQLRNTTGIFHAASSSETLNGALKGILILHTTYNVNVTNLETTDVKMHETTFQLSTQNKKEKLTAQDLIAIGKQAFLYNWYDTSIIHLLEAHNVLIKQKDRLGELKAVKELLTSVVLYHNAKLSKYGSSIGADWKSFDYQVHLGIRPSIITIFRTSYNIFI